MHYYDMSSLSLILILDEMRKDSLEVEHITKMNSVLTSILNLQISEDLGHGERLKYTENKYNFGCLCSPLL